MYHRYYIAVFAGYVTMSRSVQKGKNNDSHGSTVDLHRINQLQEFAGIKEWDY